MDDTKYAGAFQIIMNAGNSKSAFLMAIEAAKDGDMEEAQARLKEAETEMRAAHQAQIDMIQQEAAGNPVDVNIILVHAQDHLTMAILAKDLAEQFVELYGQMAELKRQMKL
ncbi:MAG: PTS lactose/cellobiose transporter subunit IIA [Clostridium sp.]|nr:PTS lactose/cellobiose transporter subunit IIA [Clostridium sp.]